MLKFLVGVTVILWREENGFNLDLDHVNRELIGVEDRVFVPGLDNERTGTIAVFNIGCCLVAYTFDT
jgi:hypothetical protein